MTTIHPRSSWGARYADGDKDLTGLAAEVFIHHSVTPQIGDDVAAEQAAMRSLEAIGQSRFQRGISYNVLVFPSGRAYQGVSFNRRGTHTDSRNSTVRSICFAGNYEEHEPTAAQLATARAIIAEGRGVLWVQGAPVRGHRDIKATACPGKNVYRRLAELAAGGVTPVTSPAPTAPPADTRPRNGDGSLTIAADGDRGGATNARWQEVMGTPIDGTISKPSLLIEADQHFLNSVVDHGHIRNLTGKDTLKPDGYEGKLTVVVRQFWLFNTTGPRILGRGPLMSDFDGVAGARTTTLHQHALNAATARSGRY